MTYAYFQSLNINFDVVIKDIFIEGIGIAIVLGLFLLLIDEFNYDII